MRLLVLSTLVLSVFGCASLGPVYQEQTLTNKKMAQLNIYRVKKFAGSAGSPYLCLDSKVIGELTNGGYFVTEIEPGEHILMRKTMGANAGDVKFTAKAGESYYLRADYSNDNGAKQSADAGRQAALGPAGGGALGAVMSAGFFGGASEKQAVLDASDKRTNSAASNPGFLFVTPQFAKTEITQTKKFVVPEYKTDPCAPKKKEETKPEAPRASSV
jgi:hypothetical protein